MPDKIKSFIYVLINLLYVHEKKNKNTKRH